MKALVIILAALLVLPHPVAVAAVVVVVGVELAACSALGALIWRAARPHRNPYPGRHRRTA